MSASLDVLIPQITAWQAKTFPTATLSSCMTHLRREVEELASNPKDGEEIADVFFLLLAVANQAGVNLAEEVAKKFEKNLKRKWKEPDAEGVVEHVKEPFPGVTKIPGVCGGRACIEGTRMPVWALVQMSAELEWTDAEIFRAYPDLPANALEIALHYEASHYEEIRRDIAENEGGEAGEE